MHNADEDHEFAVLVAVIVLIAVFVYCRVTVSGAKHRPPLQPNAQQAEEKVGHLER